MRNLYLRIFLAFWTAMVLVLTFTVVATLWLADQRLQSEQDRQGVLARQASTVLAREGNSGIAQLARAPGSTAEPALRSR